MKNKPIMKVSERTLKWMLRCYPPLLFQRIWVVRIQKGFTGIDIRVKKSVFNINPNGAIFGGTIFSAADPFYPLLFQQIFNHQGYKTLVWVKSAAIHYLKPARSTLSFSIRISNEEKEEAKKSIDNTGIFIKNYPIMLYNLTGELCACVHNEVYIRDLNYQTTPISTDKTTTS